MVRIDSTAAKRLLTNHVSIDALEVQESVDFYVGLNACDHEPIRRSGAIFRADERSDVIPGVISADDRLGLQHLRRRRQAL